LAGVAAVGALALAAAVAPGVPTDGRRGPEDLRGQYIVVYRGSVQDPAAQTDKHERGKGSMSGSATAAREGLRRDPDGPPRNCSPHLARRR
jgi:hypothetical protein